MKVIGTNKNEYICTIGHSELEKFMNLYYNKMERLKVDDEVDLGAGYNFERKTRDALNQTQSFIKENKKVIEAIFNGIAIMSDSDFAEKE